MATGVNLWKEVLANSSHETAASQPIPLYCEWLRLLVGRSLALASFSNSNKKYKYLILGINLLDLKDDESINLNLIKALEADLMVLQTALESCKQSLRDNSPIESPEIFLRSFSILAMLRLPQESKDWVLTDEGLTIINWGLTSGRLFFEWNESQFEQIKKDLLQRIRTSRSGNVSSTSTSRDAQEESRQQAKLNSAAHKSVPSPAVPVKAATNIPVTSVNNTKQPVSSIQSDNPPTWLLALLALCLIIIGGIFGATAYKLWSSPSKSNETPVITESQKSDDSSQSAGAKNTKTTREESKPEADKNNKNSDDGASAKTIAPPKQDHSRTSSHADPSAPEPKTTPEVQSSGTSPTAATQGHSNQQPKSPKSLKADHHQSQELSK